MALKGSSSIITGRHEIVASTYQSFLAVPLERRDMGSPRNSDRPNASLRYVGASSPDHLRIPKISVRRLDDGSIVRTALLRQRAPYHEYLRHLGGGRIVEYATAGRAMLVDTHVPIARRCFGPPLIGGPQGRVACGLAEGRIPARRLTERRSLRLPRRAECAFPSRRRPGGAGHNPPPACGALWKMAQLGKCARATPRQAAGGLRQGPLTIPGEVDVSRQSGSARQVAGPPCLPARMRHAPRSRRRTRRPRGHLA